MATRKKTYARKTRTKRSGAIKWGISKITVRNLLYGITFFGGFGWLTGIFNQVNGNPLWQQVSSIFDIKLPELPENKNAKEAGKTDEDEGEADVKAKNTSSRQDNPQDDENPELPAITKKDQKRVVKHQYYTLLYNEKHEQAEWVAYKLLKKYVEGEVKRQNNFRPDPDVITGSAVPADYKNSGYDRGHLAPAGDFKFSTEAMSESFFMSNMSPQVHDFNAGIWEQLESKCRTWAKQRGKIYIVSGPILQDDLPTIGAKNQVSVPKEYFKVILDPEKKQMIGFIMQNRMSFKQVPTYAIAVDEIEKRTGIDFFPYLPDEEEDAMESQVKTNEWFFAKKK